MAGDEATVTRTDRTRGFNERLATHATDLGANELDDLRPADQRQRQDETGGPQRTREQHEHDREEQLRDGGNARGDDADHLRERATVPAGEKTEDEPEAEAYERRAEHDRERQSCAAEYA